MTTNERPSSLSARLSMVPDLVKVPLLLVLAAGVGMLGTYTSTPPDSTYSIELVLVAGALAGASVMGSVLGYRRLVPRLGLFTSVAALTIFWALTWGLIALLPSECPGAVGVSGRCSVADVGAYVVVGALFPLSIAALLLPGLLILRALRRLTMLVLRRYLPERFPDKGATASTSATPSRVTSAERKRRRSGNPATRAGTPKTPRAAP